MYCRFLHMFLSQYVWYLDTAFGMSTVSFEYVINGQGTQK